MEIEWDAEWQRGQITDEDQSGAARGVRTLLSETSAKEVQIKWAGGGTTTYRPKPQPRYVMKNVQDVRVGDVVKDEGEVRKAEHISGHVILQMRIRVSYPNSGTVEVEVRG